MRKAVFRVTVVAATLAAVSAIAEVYTRTGNVSTHWADAADWVVGGGPATVTPGTVVIVR